MSIEGWQILCSSHQSVDRSDISFGSRTFIFGQFKGLHHLNQIPTGL
jgi:hypothetical protein